MIKNKSNFNFFDGFMIKINNLYLRKKIFTYISNISKYLMGSYKKFS